MPKNYSPKNLQGQNFSSVICRFILWMAPLTGIAIPLILHAENDIPVEGNYINIRVDAHTGEIENYSFTWSWEALPSSENIISLREAEQVFRDEIGLKLIYRRFYDYRSQSDDIKLVYTLESGRVLIDAATGKLLDNEYYDLYSREAAGEAAMKADSGLTPVELEEVEITKNCISKEEAVNIAKKYISIPGDFKLRSANLYKDYDNPDQKVWSLEWDKSGDNNEGGYYIYARVNAITSELLALTFTTTAKLHRSLSKNTTGRPHRKRLRSF